MVTTTKINKINQIKTIMKKLIIINITIGLALTMLIVIYEMYSTKKLKRRIVIEYGNGTIDTIQTTYYGSLHLSISATNYYLIDRKLNIIKNNVKHYKILNEKDFPCK